VTFHDGYHQGKKWCKVCGKWNVRAFCLIFHNAVRVHMLDKCSSKYTMSVSWTFLCDPIAFWQRLAPNLNNTLFLNFWVYFEGSPLRRRTLGCYPKGAPPILYVPMFPWKYFFSKKWGKMEGKKKREWRKHRESLLGGGGGGPSGWEIRCFYKESFKTN
jgi:hypothetical protein